MSAHHVHRPPPLLGYNAPVYLMRADGNSAPQYPAKLLGTAEHEAVIVGGLSGRPFGVGERLIARMAQNGNAVGFECTVLGLAEHPFPHYFLSYPDSVESLDLRRGRRVPAMLPTRVSLDGARPLPKPQGRPCRGTVLDLSTTGCALSLRHPLEDDEELRLTFALPGRADELRVTVTVVSRRTKDGLYIHGMRFKDDETTRTALSDLQRWISELQQYTP